MSFPLWKGLVTAVASVSLFFALLEGISRLAGVEPLFVAEDPFVGFSCSPLFVEAIGADGRPAYVTAPEKHLFNRQEFPVEKEPNTYRIFCLGGSTTYGHPYDDTVSFAGWLREFLPVADPSRRWEVVNCGGISYASYRVAHLVKELSRYEPDLLLVYTGHNEFLEERTYRRLRSIPAPIRAIAGLLSRTRTWAAMSAGLRSLGFGRGGADSRERLKEEADTLLEHFGPEVYTRNDALAAEVLAHFELSLQRIAALGKSAGADVLFVEPASNLKDFSPFKSEPTDGLEPEMQARVETLSAEAMTLEGRLSWAEALERLDAAVGLDPRNAALHYRRGRALLALGRHDEAALAFRTARDEDVCPLRALSAMSAIVARVARETESRFVGFADLLAERSRRDNGHGILGAEQFLDHVHPTIEANRWLALWILDEMIAAGIVEPVASWGEEGALSVATQRVRARLDPVREARSLANLAKVLAWGGKLDDASRPAAAALATGVTDPEVVVSAAGILATQAAMEGDFARESHYRRMALHAGPTSAETHFRIGLRALDLEPPDLELALSHLFFASVFWVGTNRDEPHRTIAKVMAERGRFGAALSHLLEAQTIDPANGETGALIQEVATRLGPAARDVVSPKIDIERYPSGALRRITQVREAGTAGRYVPDVIWTDWYEGGEVRRYVDYEKGAPHGVEVVWDESAEVISRTAYRHGVPASGAP